MRIQILSRSPARRAALSALEAAVPGCEVLGSTGDLEAAIDGRAELVLLGVEMGDPAAATIVRLRTAHPQLLIVVVGDGALSPEFQALYRALGADASMNERDAPSSLAQLLADPPSRDPLPVESAADDGFDDAGPSLSLRSDAAADRDGILALAAELFDAPVTFVNLVGETCAWCGSTVTSEVGESNDGCPFCPCAIELAAVLVVPDAVADRRFRHSTHVQGPLRVRFFAGAPLIDRRGKAIGALCIVDTVPHRPFAEAVGILHRMADHLLSLSELRARNRQLQARTKVLASIENELRATRSAQEALLGFLGGVVFEIDANTLAMTRVSDAMECLFGYRRDWWLAQPHFWRSLVVDADRDAAFAAIRRCADMGGDESIAFAVQDSRGVPVRLRGRVQRIDAGTQSWRLRLLLAPADPPPDGAVDRGSSPR
ncbi:MAG: GAF domain-containing protein [Burkholderiales bacterium]